MISTKGANNISMLFFKVVFHLVINAVEVRPIFRPQLPAGSHDGVPAHKFACHNIISQVSYSRKLSIDGENFCRLSITFVEC